MGWEDKLKRIPAQPKAVKNGKEPSMKVESTDLDDSRVVQHSSDALDYPDDVDKAPDKAGVYMFINAADEVVYVGKASGGRLKDEIKAKKGTDADKGATKFRWFRTNSDEVAKTLEADWINKYAPRNNVRGKNSVLESYLPNG